MNPQSGRDLPPAVFVMGPTASGKTALACELADAFPASLISVDSALVYRGMDIGTAKPDAELRARYPHALLDLRDPLESYSAADFRLDALDAMHAALAAGRIPVLVGGTGLYFRALERGLSPLPAARPELRARLTREAHELGWPALHARLASLDPAAAARIRPNDPQRIQRALEVIELTGMPLSQLHQQSMVPLPWRILKLALIPTDRERLRQRIAQRFDAMLAAGFLGEVEQLRARGDLHADLPALRAVGYRQAWAHLAGDCDFATFHTLSLHASRQLAKRQLTWLRGEEGLRRLDPFAPDAVANAIEIVAEFLGPPQHQHGDRHGLN